MIPLLLGLFGALFYFGNSEVRRFEGLAARDIRASIHGEHAKVSVRTELNGIIGGPLGDLKQVTIRASDFETDGVPLFTQPELSKKGVIRDLRIELRNFTLAGLHVQELVSDIPDCRFDYALALSKHKIRLSQSGVGRGEVTVKQEDLERYILKKFREVKRVVVRIEQGRVRVEGYGEFLILKSEFSVDAKIVAVGGTKLELEDARISLDGKEADDESRKVLLETLNPVIDLSRDLKLYDAILVDQIELEDGVMRAEGSTKIPVQPREPPASSSARSSPRRARPAGLPDTLGVLSQRASRTTSGRRLHGSPSRALRGTLGPTSGVVPREGVSSRSTRRSAESRRTGRR